MTIAFSKDPYFLSLFYLEKNASDSTILTTVQQAFEGLGVETTVQVEGEAITVEVVGSTVDRSGSVDRVATLASKGKFDQALQLIEKELKQHPTLSELYRMRGQILSEQGDQEGGINSLIDALRFDPENKWALIMMGNIFAREQGDIDTGLVYFEKALEVDPNDNIALNNIGAMMLEAGKPERGFELFNQALAIDPTYPNTYLGLSLGYQRQQDFEKSFSWAIQGLKKGSPNGQVGSALTKQAFQTAQVLVGRNDGMRTVLGFVAELEEKSGKEIRIEETSDIPFTAKLEVAENYDRDYHFVRYKPNAPAVAHLVMHELMHLELILEARSTNENELFITSRKHELAFKSRLGKYMKTLKKKGFGTESVNGVISQLFSGLNAQIYNTPIDQFIEQRIYDRFKTLRPHQFLSLMTLTKEAIDAVTRKEIVELSDPWILDRSKTYNVINTLGLKRHYGVDLIKQLKATQAQIRTAKKLFTEFEDYLKDKKPAEEYDLVNNWADTLGMLPYFDLLKESEYRAQKADPIHLPEPDLITTSSVSKSKRDQDEKQFLESHGNKDINMAVVMFMVGALKRFRAMRPEQVKRVAFQIAQIGVNGISPEKDGYHVPLIPGSNFSGYQMLAHYYVSWALEVPEMLDQIGMPFEKEYATAQQMAGK